MSTIPKIDGSVLRYLARFDLHAIAETEDRRLVSTRNPAGHRQAWWCNSLDVGRVIRRARRDNGDVVRAAAALGVKLAPHGYVMQSCRTPRKLSRGSTPGW
jgi:hypothetical protein